MNSNNNHSPASIGNTGQTSEAAANPASKDDGLRFEGRTVPWPKSISPEAVAALKRGAEQPRFHWPDLSDKEAWRKVITEFNVGMARFIKAVAPGIGVRTETLANVTVYRARPQALPADLPPAGSLDLM